MNKTFLIAGVLALALLLRGDAPTPPTSWEYKIVQTERDAPPFEFGTEKILNAQGVMGWELVALHEGHSGSMGQKFYYLYLKRPVRKIRAN